MRLDHRFVFLLFVLLSVGLHAKVKLPSILANNMVLQQLTEVKLWGAANPNVKVKIFTSWDKKSYALVTDEKGNWMQKIKTPMAGGPFEITFNDGEKMTLSNILFGEVWFCSGQSNMEMPIRGFDRQPVVGGAHVIAKAKVSTPIRIFNTDMANGKRIRQISKQPQTDCIGLWELNTPENVATTSAAAYYFARYLQEVLDVPVGIIQSTLGGSAVQAWMSREAIEPFKEINLSILDNNEEIKSPQVTPCCLFNAKINPLLNFSIKGMIWYQGESNRNNADLYAKLVPAFVNDLRKSWGVGEFPFYYVQIAPFNYEHPDSTSAASLREVQTEMMRDIRNSGMVSTLDIGHPNFIHPGDKETVGNRLAWWALGQTYFVKGIEYATPVYKSMEKVGSKIYINFSNAEQGISPMWTDLKGFEIAGVDKVFYPAKAEIETKTTRLAVSCFKVPQPVAVRYGYKNYSEASIFSLSGIPVAPFRTDNW